MERGHEGPHISVVSPVYLGELTVGELVQRLRTNLESITDSYEIILVEDCGPDASWERIQQLSNADSKVKGIKLSKNFGQHHAISAGLAASRGQWVVVMDCDLQDVPEEIPRLYQKTKEGYHVVLACRKIRSDSWFKKITSRLFYSLLSFLTGLDQDSSVANFGIYHRKVINEVAAMTESIRYFPSMIKWVGFKTAKVDVKHDERFAGSSSYTLARLLHLSVDIILAYSDKPLRLTIGFGVSIALITFIFAVVNVYRALTGQIEVLGYSSIIISVWLLGGLIIAILGVVGLYVGKTFEGVKNRPVYIIELTTWEK